MEQSQLIIETTQPNQALLLIAIASLLHTE
jgi:hypothetical protein